MTPIDFNAQICNGDLYLAQTKITGHCVEAFPLKYNNNKSLMEL